MTYFSMRSTREMLINLKFNWLIIICIAHCVSIQNNTVPINAILIWFYFSFENWLEFSRLFHSTNDKEILRTSTSYFSTCNELNLSLTKISFFFLSHYFHLSIFLSPSWWVIKFTCHFLVSLRDKLSKLKFKWSNKIVSFQIMELSCVVSIIDINSEVLLHFKIVIYIHWCHKNWIQTICDYLSLTKLCLSTSPIDLPEHTKRICFWWAVKIR